MKNAVFFLLRAPTHHTFTFNLRFLYELKHKFRLSKLYMGFPIFDFTSLLLKFVFLFNKMHGLFDLKTSVPFKIKIIEKLHTVLLPDLWFLSCKKKFWNSVTSAWVGALQKHKWLCHYTVIWVVSVLQSCTSCT